jgi:hypothetical protein
VRTTPLLKATRRVGVLPFAGLSLLQALLIGLALLVTGGALRKGWSPKTT